MSKTVLIFEDDLDLARLVELDLKLEGYETRHVTSGHEGVTLIKESTIKPDLIIMDIRMPDENGRIDNLAGFYAAEEIRTFSEDTIPIIFLTTKDTIADKLKGLNVGVDYVTKPFDCQELMARVKIALRRTHVQESTVYMAGGGELVFDVDKMQVMVNGKVVESLTPMEKQILLDMMKNMDNPRTHEQLYKAAKVPPDEDMDMTASVRYHVMNIREKIETDPRPKYCRYVKNERGTGYKVVSHE